MFRPFGIIFIQFWCDPIPVCYDEFCEHYSEWCAENAETLHFDAVIGEKMEVDFAGKTFEITDPLTGEIYTPYTNSAIP